MGATDTVAKETLTRGQKLWLTLRERRDVEPVSLERAKLLTASFKETEGLPVPIRRAEAFEKIVTEIPIYIDDGQLLVGDFASRPMAAEWYPDSEVESVIKEIKDGKSPYKVAESDMPILTEICDYWKYRAVTESFLRLLGEEEAKELLECAEQGAWIHSLLTEVPKDKGWYVPDYPKAIRKGLLGILDEVEEQLQATSILDEESSKRVYFLKSLKTVLKAGVQYAKRYSSLATELSKKANGERKAELEKIAEVCAWVPEHPARSFHEALQTVWFCHLLIYWDTNAPGVGLGRVDQYLYPYYKRDIEEGKLTREDAIELLECLRVKLSAMIYFQPGALREVQAGYAQFHNCTLGGQTADGQDATNELSYLWLEAAMRTRTPHPTLSVRVHENLSSDFAMKAAELSKLGLGYPAWFGDKSAIAYLLSKGCTLEEARDYALAGCVIHVIPHKTAPTHPILMSMPKILELAMNDGVDPRLGKQLGPKTGKFMDLSYDELCESFKKQAEYFLMKTAKSMNERRLYRSSIMPQLAGSCFFDDCIKRGQDALSGGTVYQHSCMYLLPIGVTDVADSLAAIKHRVYEEKSVSKQELMDALSANFEGKEATRQLLLSSPKYGNDDDYADSIVTDLYRWLSRFLDTLEAPYGARYVASPHNIASHGASGVRVGALPSGRLGGVSLSDGAVSPCQGVDVKGPTAVIQSAAKIEQEPLLGALLNMKFHPSALKTKDDLEKFLALIKAYLIGYEGKHIQFNVISRETLLDAQAHPENYRNLVIRVAGYSALWVELDRTIQNEIISRTEHSF